MCGGSCTSFMSPVSYARFALKAGEFIEHCGGTYHNTVLAFFIKARDYKLSHSFS